MDTIALLHYVCVHISCDVAGSIVLYYPVGWDLPFTARRLCFLRVLSYWSRKSELYHQWTLQLQGRGGRTELRNLSPWLLELWTKWLPMYVCLSVNRIHLTHMLGSVVFVLLRAMCGPGKPWWLVATLHCWSPRSLQHLHKSAHVQNSIFVLLCAICTLERLSWSATNKLISYQQSPHYSDHFQPALSWIPVMCLHLSNSSYYAYVRFWSRFTISFPFQLAVVIELEPIPDRYVMRWVGTASALPSTRGKRVGSAIPPGYT